MKTRKTTLLSLLLLTSLVSCVDDVYLGTLEDRPDDSAGGTAQQGLPAGGSKAFATGGRLVGGGHGEGVGGAQGQGQQGGAGPAAAGGVTIGLGGGGAGGDQSHRGGA